MSLWKGFIQLIKGYTEKIDNAQTDGLEGVTNSLAYRVEELEKHIHNREKWFGNGAVEDSLTPYTLISGNNDFGQEVLLLDTGDTPVDNGYDFFDLHKVEIINVDTASSYLIRIIWGNGTVGEAETAKQYTTLSVTPSGVGSNVAGAPVPILCPRIPVGSKVWAKCKNATNLAEIEILHGLHEYIG
jgi:hypothetical protein